MPTNNGTSRGVPEAECPNFGWRAASSVELWLREQPYGFDFFQAVKILEALSPQLQSAASTSDPELEPVRFRSNIGLDFPPSDIHNVGDVKSKRLGGATEMVVSFLSLAGAL